MNMKSMSASAQPLITMENVWRQVEGSRLQTKTLLKNINWSLYSGDRIAVISTRRGEADVFLECACGVVPVQNGRVNISAHVSWPMGQPAALLGNLSAQLNADFLLRIYGDPYRRFEQMQTIRLLSDLENDFHERPLRAYNSAMKARFRLALSIVFDFDVYMIPNLEAWNFKAKSIRVQRFRELFESMTANKSLLVSNSDQGFQKQYCHSGLILDNGTIVYEGDLDSCYAWLARREASLKASHS